MICRLFLLSLTLVSASRIAQAWWGSGHEQIADIAWTRLKPEVKKEIAEILNAGDLEFRPLSDAEEDVRKAFRHSAAWADWMKDHSDGIYEPEIKTWNAKFQPGYDPNDPDREAHRCKRWHYFDTPVRVKTSPPAPKSSNALVALTTAREQFTNLAQAADKDRKQQCWWLYWLEHVIGDLHQPLHCSEDCQFEATGDQGGNLFKLGIGFPDRPDRMMNLHALWDQGIDNAIALEPDKPHDVESVTSRWTETYTSVEKDSENLGFSSWIATGAKLSVDVVYQGISRDGKPSDEYRDKQADLCRHLAVLAGYRLANELNKDLGG